ncbi:iron transport multicopper oxidase fetC-like [Folsomia candida]|uniref:iron transport multicopper oxidase fetC-like n=1 Tax=Folsomia candida TaxID=158441 RepID=UPI0016053CAF|nr:iron transport multicopper oxidase fetC-like [Folsomia candida]
MSIKHLPTFLLIYTATTQGDFQVNLFTQPGCQGDANRIQIPHGNLNPNPFQCTEVAGDRGNFNTRSVSVGGSSAGNSCTGGVILSSQRYCGMTGTQFNVPCSGACADVNLSVGSIMTPNSNLRRASDSTTQRISARQTFSSTDNKPSFHVNLFSQPNCAGRANRISILQDYGNPNNFQCTEVAGDRGNFAAKSVQIGFNGVTCQDVTLSDRTYCSGGKTYRIQCGDGCANVYVTVRSILLTKNVGTNAPAQRVATTRAPQQLSFSMQQRAMNLGVGDPSLLEVSLFSAPNCGGTANHVSVRRHWANPNNFQCTEVAGQRGNFYTRSVQTGSCQGFSVTLHPATQCTKSNSFQLECGTCANVELSVKSILVERGRTGSRPAAITPPPPVRPGNVDLPPRSEDLRSPNEHFPRDENGNTTGKNILRHRFHISYNSFAPDGVTVPHVLTINNHFPGPILYGTVGDTMEVVVTNGIQDGQNVTLHWHGIHQKGTPFQDGPSFVTQCPIRAGRSQTYRFPLRQSGTYWYHSHVGSQYTEGLWGALVVQGRRKVYNYDAEFTITLNDWYHTSAKENEEWFLTSRSGGFPPYPYSALMNGLGQYGCEFTSKPCSPEKQQRPVFHLNPGRIYRIRLINTSAWTSFNFAIDGHKLLPIEVDGVDVKVAQEFYGSDDPDSVFIGPGQRYSFLLKKIGGGSYNKHVIRAILREDLIGSPPHNINENIASLNPLVTGLIVYTNDERHREVTIVPMDVENFDYTSYIARPLIRNYIQLNDSHLVPHDRKSAPQRTDKEYVVTVVRTTDENNVHHVSFNNSAFSLPHDRPLLISMMRNVTLPASSFPLYIEHNQVVQLVVNNPSFGVHPMHLHGHTFWVMGAGEPGEGDYSPERHRLNRNGLRRDTVMVQEWSWLVIKFIADNPGVWAFHCHIDWHNLAGMALTFVEAPDVARAKLRVPAETRKVCKQHGIII